jgi:hypothetical protein
LEVERCHPERSEGAEGNLALQPLASGMETG